MPYTISWLIDKRVMHFFIEGEMTTDLLRNLLADSRKLTIEEGISPVHAVVDATNARSIPKDVNAVLKEHRKTVPENNGFSVLISTSPLTRFFAQTLFKILRLEIRFAKDQDEALKILYRVDMTLPQSDTATPQ